MCVVWGDRGRWGAGEAGRSVKVWPRAGKSGNAGDDQRETGGPTRGHTKEREQGWKNEILGNNAGFLQLAMV